MSSLLLERKPEQKELLEQITVAKPVVSFVLPIYNGGRQAAQRILQWVYAQERAIAQDFEVVVVDDGSKDDTFAALSSIKHERIKLVRKANGGKGHALMYGVGFTKSDTIIFADGDLQALPSNFADFLISLSKADISIASKRVVGSRVEAGFKRKFLSIGFNCMVRVLVSLPLADTQAGFKVFKRSALQRILPLVSVKGYAFDVELLVVAHMLGLKIAELPTMVKLDSSFKPRNILRMLVDILGIAYRLRIKGWYQRNLEEESPLYMPLLRW